MTRQPNAAAVLDAVHHLLYPLIEPDSDAEHAAFDASTPADLDIAARVYDTADVRFGSATPEDYLACAVRLLWLAYADGDAETQRKVERAIAALEGGA